RRGRRGVWTTGGRPAAEGRWARSAGRGGGGPAERAWPKVPPARGLVGGAAGAARTAPASRRCARTLRAEASMGATSVTSIALSRPRIAHTGKISDGSGWDLLGKLLPTGPPAGLAFGCAGLAPRLPDHKPPMIRPRRHPPA